MATLAAVRTAREEPGLSVMELWIAYFSMGGNRDADQLSAYLASDGHDLGPAEHDHLIDALNDVYLDRGLDHPLSHGIT